MTDFFIFYAPFLVIIVAIVISFWFASKDDIVKK